MDPISRTLFYSEVIILIAGVLFFFLFMFTVERFILLRTAFKIIHRVLSMILKPVLKYGLALFLFSILFGIVGIKNGIQLNYEVLGISAVMIFAITELVAFLWGVLEMVMFIRGIGNKITYERFGTLEHWGVRTRNYKKEIQWVQVISEKLVGYFKQWPAYQNIKVLAPAANNGEEELELAQALGKYLGKRIHMRTSDVTPMVHQSAISTPYVEFTYEVCDVFNLKSILHDLQNVIYDPKGILWYTYGKEKKVNQALQLFYDLLAPDGIIVIDAAENRKKLQSKNRMRLLYGRELTYYCEKSTYDFIEKCFTPDSLANKLFTLERVDGLDGPFGMAILRKVQVNQSDVKADSDSDEFSIKVFHM